MRFDRQIFWAEYRKLFSPVRQYQVDGLERLLDLYSQYWGWWDSIPQIANSLAQIKRETADSFLPVVEGFYVARGVPKDAKYFSGDYNAVRRFQGKLRYYPHYGMGHIQLTWAENFRKHDRLVRRYFPELVAEFAEKHKREMNLIERPRDILDANISFAVMTVGMHNGTFRKRHTLDRYINDSKIDHFNARSIVNGDKFYPKKNEFGKRELIGNQITRHAIKFEEILEASLLNESNEPNAVGSTSFAPQPENPVGNPSGASTSPLKPCRNDRPQGVHIRRSGRPWKLW